MNTTRSDTGALLLKLMIVTVSIMLPSSAARAAWPSDPAANLPIADGPGEHSQPKFALTDDGGCYVSWFQNSGTGYDVYVQHLDTDGNEDWAHNGALVESRSYSSTQDYGICRGPQDNAVIIFNALRGGNEEIIAQSVSITGELLWGGGAQISDNSTMAFLGGPCIAATSDGAYMAGWLSDDVSLVQRINADGSLAWADPVALVDPQGSGWLWIRNLIPAENGSVIAVMTRNGAFWDPRHLYVQKIASDGSLLWGSEHVAVLDSGSLQVAYGPPARSDGAGGVLLAWYTVHADLQCWMQRVLSDGTEVFPHNGVQLSTRSGQQRVSPSIAFDPVTENSFAAWVETDMIQADTGICAQKISPAGDLLWTDFGIEITPLQSTFHLFPVAEMCGDGIYLTYFTQTMSLVDTIKGARLAADGGHMWTPAIIDISTMPSEKYHLDHTLALSGSLLLTWADAGAATGGIYAQSINPDGSLGPTTPATPTPVLSPTPELTETPSPTVTVPPTATVSPEPTATIAPPTPTPAPTLPPTVPPTATPEPTSSPSPTLTPPPEPTETPTVPPQETPTATPPCGTLGCKIRMPSTMFRPNDLCYVELGICNPGTETYVNVPLFVLLDVMGTYFYGPGFTSEFDGYRQDVPPGETWLTIVPEFIWPTGAGSASGINWYGAMTDEAVTQLFGEFGMFTFGFTE